MTKSKQKRQRWLPWQEEFLRRNYADSLTVDLAKVLETTIKRVLAKANAMGLHKSLALIAETARERNSRPDNGNRRTRIQPGAVPWNKGKHYVAGGRSAETRFKPGGRPMTWVPVGSYRVKEGNLQQKISDQPGNDVMRWAPVSRLVWEAAHGPVPAGHKVVFKPGRHSTDVEEVTLDSVELLSDEALMRRNSYHSTLPPEMARMVQLRGVLTRAINRKISKEDTAA
jgi:hypothetical protein